MVHGLPTFASGVMVASGVGVLPSATLTQRGTDGRERAPRREEPAGRKDAAVTDLIA